MDRILYAVIKRIKTDNTYLAANYFAFSHYILTLFYYFWQYYW